MTNGIVAASPALPTPYRQTESLRETASYSAASQEIRYTDADGRSFTLSLGTETATYSLTYDRTAQVRTGQARHGREGARHGHHGRHERLRGVHEDLKELEKTLRSAGIEVKGFKRLLHRMLKAVDHDYRERFRHADPVEREAVALEQVHVDVTAVAQQVTVAMDDVDPEYWSVENTAQRLADFGVGLYRGGDRSAHSEQMVEAMKQGYAEAREAFGGALPEIADQTIDRAGELLADWAAQAPEESAPLEMVA